MGKIFGLKLVLIVFFASIIVLLIGGCDSDDAKRPTRYQMKCNAYDVVVEVVDADTLNTAINGEKIEMHRAASTNGTKYTGKGAVVQASVWNKGSEWALFIDRGGAIYCKVTKTTR